MGDALGTTLEFTPRDSRPRLTGMVGGGPFRLQPGQWTGDTMMALALMESLIMHPRLDEADLMRRFVLWQDRARTLAPAPALTSATPFAPRSAGSGQAAIRSLVRPIRARRATAA